VAAPKAAPGRPCAGDRCGGGNCDPSYPEVASLRRPRTWTARRSRTGGFKVIGADPHRFDGDHDGIGCEK